MAEIQDRKQDQAVREQGDGPREPTDPAHCEPKSRIDESTTIRCASSSDGYIGSNLPKSSHDTVGNVPRKAYAMRAPAGPA